MAPTWCKKSWEDLLRILWFHWDSMDRSSLWSGSGLFSYMVRTNKIGYFTCGDATMRVDAAKVFPDNTLSLPKVFIGIILVTGTVGVTVISWYPISRSVALLMEPKVSWLGFVSCLYYCIWRDNPKTKRKDTFVSLMLVTVWKCI